MQVRPNLFLGGADGLCESVNNGDVLPESVFWFCRYAGWTRAQLTEECARNVWYPVSCSTSMLLPRMPKNNREGPNLWHDIMELVGGALCLIRGDACIRHARPSVLVDSQ